MTSDDKSHPIMMQNRSLLLLLAAATAVFGSPGVLHFCNRGYCYTRKEPLTPLSLQLTNNPSTKKTRRASGVNFCRESTSLGEDNGRVADCELFHILGTDRVDAEFEAVECGSAACERMQERSTATVDSYYQTVDGEVMETMDFDDNEESAHVSWKDRPQKGRCYDHDLGYEFDCNLVQILDEGLVLIEDLRAGGIFAAQPKSGFSTRDKKHHRNAVPRTPEVMNGSGITDVTQDFRTNVFLNLEGI